MRVSTDKNSPAYNPQAEGARYFLDGAPVENVSAADDAEGWLEVVPTDKATDKDAKTKVIRMSGKVRIELAPAPPATPADPEGRLDEFKAKP